jgi:hypothetical protein
MGAVDDMAISGVGTLAMPAVWRQQLPLGIPVEKAENNQTEPHVPWRWRRQLQ